MATTAVMIVYVTVNVPLRAIEHNRRGGGGFGDGGCWWSLLQ